MPDACIGGKSFCDVHDAAISDIENSRIKKSCFLSDFKDSLILRQYVAGFLTNPLTCVLKL